MPDNTESVEIQADETTLAEAIKAPVVDKQKAKKKGKATWQPAARLATYDRKPGWAYRLCDKSPENLERYRAEGWVPVNASTGVPGEFSEEENQTSGVKQHRELVLYALPDDLAEARREHYDNLTAHSEQSLLRQSKKKIEDTGTEAFGKIVIE